MTAFINGTIGGAPRYAIGGALTSLQNVPGSTVCGWVNYLGGFTTNEQVICNISSGTSLSSARANISLRHSSGLYRASARRLDSDSIAIVDSTTSISGVRRFICGVFDYSNQTAQIYVNGTLENSLFVAGWTGNSSNTPSLGAAIGGRADGNASSSLNVSEVEGVQVFSRALSAAEIRGLYLTKGRSNNYYQQTNYLRLQGALPFATFATSKDSIDDGSAVAAGTPTIVGALSNITTNRRRRVR